MPSRFILFMALSPPDIFYIFCSGPGTDRGLTKLSKCMNRAIHFSLKQGNWGSERLNKVPKIKYLANSTAGIQTRSVRRPKLLLFPVHPTVCFLTILSPVRWYHYQTLGLNTFLCTIRKSSLQCIQFILSHKWRHKEALWKRRLSWPPKKKHSHFIITNHFCHTANLKFDLTYITGSFSKDIPHLLQNKFIMNF